MHTMRFTRVCFALAACLAAWGGSMRAGAAGSDKSCFLDGASVMAFGTYDSMNDTPLDVQGRVSYRCTPHGGSGGAQRGPLVVQISMTQGHSASFNRYMFGNRDRLRYNLYLDSQHSRVWGDGTGGSSIYSAQAQPNNKVVVVPVFGRLFAGQDVAGGMYLDDLIVTLDF
jgi:spore coat protein U-like protein